MVDDLKVNYKFCHNNVSVSAKTFAYFPRDCLTERSNLEEFGNISHNSTSKLTLHSSIRDGAPWEMLLKIGNVCPSMLQMILNSSEFISIGIKSDQKFCLLNHSVSTFFPCVCNFHVLPPNI